MARTNILWVGRVATFGVVILFSIIELGLAAGYIAKVSDLGFDTPDYAGLALAISLVTLLAIVPMTAIDFIRRGAITSWILVELVVTGLLTVLWLATAADTAAATDGVTVNCSGSRGDAATICHTYQAIEAFAFLTWLLFMFYFGGLLALAVIAQIRRNPPWRNSVRETNFFAKSAAAPYGAPVTQQVYAPAPQASYPPQPVYPQQQPYVPQQMPVPSPTAQA